MYIYIYIPTEGKPVKLVSARAFFFYLGFAFAACYLRCFCFWRKRVLLRHGLCRLVHDRRCRDPHRLLSLSLRSKYFLSLVTLFFSLLCPRRCTTFAATTAFPRDDDDDDLFVAGFLKYTIRSFIRVFVKNWKNFLKCSLFGPKKKLFQFFVQIVEESVLIHLLVKSRLKSCISGTPTILQR